MTIPIRPNGAGPFVSPLERGQGRGIELTAPGASFADVFKQAVGGTTEMQDNAQQIIERFLRGEPVEIHQVMAASTEASISLELLVSMRNKLTDAYRTIMNMQV